MVFVVKLLDVENGSAGVIISWLIEGIHLISQGSKQSLMYAGPMESVVDEIFSFLRWLLLPFMGCKFLFWLYGRDIFIDRHS